jgi:hypothetical protein
VNAWKIAAASSTTTRGNRRLAAHCTIVCSALGHTGLYSSKVAAAGSGRVAAIQTSGVEATADSKGIRPSQHGFGEGWAGVA